MTTVQSRCVLIAPSDLLENFARRERAESGTTREQLRKFRAGLQRLVLVLLAFFPHAIAVYNNNNNNNNINNNNDRYDLQ